MTDHSFKEFIKGKKILVTGGTGSIGRVVVKNLLRHEPRVIRILSRDPNKQIAFQEEISNPREMRYLLGDVRDAERVIMACEDVDIVFHAAAFKYVPQGEYNPFETVQTNVIGTQNLITAALKTPSITHFVMISTDKAVEPVNTMGASKLLAERLVSAAHYTKGRKNKVFTTVRFGNVLGTAGSVLQIFKEQIKGKRLTVTHPAMSRFFMTVSDAVDLVFKAVLIAHGGEIFVLKMPAVAIRDLAEVFARKYSVGPVEIVYSGVRSGEKLQESLLTSAESAGALETGDMFIVPPKVDAYDVSPGSYSYADAHPISSPYTTVTASNLSHSEILELLDRAEIL